MLDCFGHHDRQKKIRMKNHKKAKTPFPLLLLDLTLSTCLLLARQGSLIPASGSIHSYRHNVHHHIDSNLVRHNHRSHHIHILQIHLVLPDFGLDLVVLVPVLGAVLDLELAFVLDLVHFYLSS
jgi:hypothetical protein